MIDFNYNKVNKKHDNLNKNYWVVENARLTHSTIYVFQLLHHMMDGVQHVMDRGPTCDGLGYII